ncbi:MAG: hypothetical protein KIS94_06840 [Chitinophagales bacterium]|nr:hypothetical protein [Chitinophagales bacterium]
MNDKQENKLSMFIKVSDFLETNVTELTAVANIAPLQTELDANIAAITEAEGVADSDTTGFTMLKAQERIDLETITLKVSRAAAAYFTSTGNIGMVKECDFTKSELETMRDTILYVKAKKLYDIAQPADANLSSFNSGPADVAALLDAINAYYTVIQLPQEKRTQKTASGMQVDELIRKTDRLLKTLDVYMLTFEATNQLLYNTYRGARAIDDNTGGSQTNKSGTVNMSAVANIPFAESLIGSDTVLRLGNNSGTGGQLLFYFSDSTTGGVAGSEVTVEDGQSVQVTALSIGYNALLSRYLNVSNPNMSVGKWTAVIES